MTTTQHADMAQWHKEKAEGWQATAERYLARYHADPDKEYLLELYVGSVSMAEYHREQAQD